MTEDRRIRTAALLARIENAQHALERLWDNDLFTDAEKDGIDLALDRLATAVDRLEEEAS